LANARDEWDRGFRRTLDQYLAQCAFPLPTVDDPPDRRWQVHWLNNAAAIFVNHGDNRLTTDELNFFVLSVDLLGRLHVLTSQQTSDLRTQAQGIIQQLTTIAKRCWRAMSLLQAGPPTRTDQDLVVSCLPFLICSVGGQGGLALFGLRSNGWWQLQGRGRSITYQAPRTFPAQLWKILSSESRRASFLQRSLVLSITRGVLLILKLARL